jgi:hypothetical protein
MGDSAPRQQPRDAQGAGEAWDEANAEPEQEAQAEGDQPPAGDPESGPQSKFNG